jgi:hypothetical protein
MAAELHLAENALALHLFLQRLESLVDVVVTDENLHAAFLLNGSLLSDAQRAANGPLSRAQIAERALKVHLGHGISRTSPGTGRGSEIAGYG